jgi:hypothetical protein
LTQIERGKTISFFNELDIETRTMLMLEVAKRRKKTILFSFFNEVAWFQRQKIMLKNFLISSETYLFLIMDSKRTMLWNDTMSRDKTQSWLPRGLHWKEETHSGRTPC